MGTDKPHISILMAVYEPRMDWLKIQLESLNAQTYPNLRLYIRDDCSPTVPFEDIKALVAACITAFPYSMERNEQNLGSNGTFELLTKEAEGEYFAYCDQDDEWLPEKLTVLQKTTTKENAQLVCSDMHIIDGDGKEIADSITKVRKRHVFKSGDGLAQEMLVRNWVTGCTMLVNAQTAKEAMSFCPYMVHDHFLALYCARCGKILCLPDPLIKYRQHGANQTSVLMGVHDRESYIEVHIRELQRRVRWLSERFADDEQLKTPLGELTRWTEARERSMTRHGDVGTVWKYRKYGKAVSLFDIVTPYLPNSLFMLAVRLVRRNVI